MTQCFVMVWTRGSVIYKCQTYTVPVSSLLCKTLRQVTWTVLPLSSSYFIPDQGNSRLWDRLGQPHSRLKLWLTAGLGPRK